MTTKNKTILQTIFVVANALILCVLCYLFINGTLTKEFFLALVFLQIIFAAFFGYLYYTHQKLKKLAEQLRFEFTTRFLEQPRLEGMYKGNWFQLHYTSRDYGEYWGIPRTYIKLQYKDEKEFDGKVLGKYRLQVHGKSVIDSVDHIKRTYKNYLLMRIKYSLTDIKTLHSLMDLLIKISKEAELKATKRNQ